MLPRILTVMPPQGVASAGAGGCRVTHRVQPKHGSRLPPHAAWGLAERASGRVGGAKPGLAKEKPLWHLYLPVPLGAPPS